MIVFAEAVLYMFTVLLILCWLSIWLDWFNKEVRK